MNILIVTDLEGISGIDRPEMIEENDPGYSFSLERLMLDTNAAIEGAFEGGAGHVFVVDGHARGRNFLPGRLDPRAEQVTLSPEMTERIGEIDAFMEVGLHAMAGTINGFLDHTQSSTAWYHYTVNGRRCGELAQGAIYAGLYDIPYIMVSGDEAACAEARQFLGDIECAVVKYGVGRNRARLVDLNEALVRIRTAARDSLKLAERIRPYKPLCPLDIRLELCRSDQCDAIMERCAGVERLDARTVRKVVARPRQYADILF